MTSIPDSKNLASKSEKGAVWDVRPFQLVSLLDMKRFFPYSFIDSLWELEVAGEMASEKKESAPSKLSEYDQKYYQETINNVREHCERLDLDSALDQIERMDNTIELGDIDGAYTAFSAEVGQLLKCIATDLNKRLFIYVPPAQAKYYEQERLFGDLVYNNFESTRRDVAEAGNCLAVGRYTACVFHCMRVLEKGLHALVHDLNARFNAAITFPRDIEATNWGTIIDRIQDVLTQPRRRQSLTPSPTSEDLSFYAKAALEFEHFKDAWRNDVSHSRSSYDENEAKAVMEHVKAFMQQISTTLSE
ncbi:MAG TPA: hypothetical protein VF543_06215 [Pyrinomonadaceae bacterium]|jgi:hypothetical protein